MSHGTDWNRGVLRPLLQNLPICETIHYVRVFLGITAYANVDRTCPLDDQGHKVEERDVQLRAVAFPVNRVAREQNIKRLTNSSQLSAKHPW